MLMLAPMLTLGLVGPPALAQTRTADEVIDVALGALEEPLRPWRPGTSTLVPGAPVWPPYKQEPPAAQRDFRLLDSPAALPPSAGVPPGAPPTPEPPKPPKPCPKPPKPCV
jgi:hypothetical protein